MLANFLPGLREIRAPVISGYVWLLFFFLLLHTDLPTRASAGSAIKPVFALADRLSVLGVAAIASVAAYLVGSAMQELLRLGGRLLSPRRPLYGEVGSHTTSGGRHSLRESVEMRLHGITRRLFQIALSPGERGISHPPRASEVIAELPIVRTLLLGEHPELIGELDRLQAEADLRITVSVPLAALAVYLGLESSPGWFFVLVPATLLLVQGYQRQKQAGDFLARVVRIGRADPPAMTTFEVSVDAALERTDLEWELKGEMADGDGMAAFRYGNLLSSAGELEKAVEPLGIAIDRGVTQAYAELGFVREQLEEQEAAEQSYRDGAERGDAKARERLATMLRGQRRSEEALEAEQSERAEDEPTSDLDLPGEGRRLTDYRNRAATGDAKAALNLGILLRRQGKAAEAIAAFRRATELDEGDVQAWLAIGETEFKRAHYSEARVAIERALALQERKFGPNHLEVATTLSRLGAIESELGQDKHALELKQRALVVQERELGPKSPEVGLTLGNIGTCFAALGDPAKALEYYEKALEIEKREHGSEHRDVARLLGNIGTARFELGEYRESLRLGERALAIREELEGPGSLDIGRTVCNLGFVRHAFGEYAAALELFEKALRIQEDVLGPGSLVNAYALDGLGTVLIRLGRDQEAVAALRRALAIEQGFEVAQLRQVDTLARLGVALVGLGEDVEGVEMQERALGIAESELGPDHPLVASILADLGVGLIRLGRPANAAVRLRRVVEIDDPDSTRFGFAPVTALLGLAELGLAEGRPAETRSLSMQAIARVEALVGPTHPEAVAALGFLERAHETLGDQEEAEEARRRAQRIEGGADSEGEG